MNDFIKKLFLFYIFLFYYSVSLLIAEPLVHYNLDVVGTKNLVYSPDGKSLLGIKYGSVSILESHSFKEVRVLECLGEEIIQTMYSPDGKFIVTLTYNNLLNIWDANKGTIEKSLKGESRLERLIGFTSDGKFLLVTCDNYYIDIFNIYTGNKERRLTIGGKTISYDEGIKITYDNRYLIISGSNKYKILDIKNEKIVKEGDGLIVYSPDGKYIFTANKNKLIILDSDKEKEIKRIDVKDSISKVIYSPNVNQIITVCERSLKIWDFDTGLILKELEIIEDFDLKNTEFSPDGQYIIVGGCKIFETSTYNEIFKTERTSKNFSKKIVYSPDGKYLFSKTNYGISVWDSMSGMRMNAVAYDDDYDASFAFSPDRKYVASISNYYIVTIYEVNSGKIVRNWELGMDRNYNFITFSPDGKYVTVTSPIDSDSKNTRIVICDVENGKIIKQLVYASNHYYLNSSCQLIYSHTGKNFACLMSDWSVKIFDSSAFNLVASLNVFDPFEREVVSEPDSYSGVSYNSCRIAYSYDDNYIAVGTVDGRIRIWNTKTGKMVKIFREDSCCINSLTFSPDGKYIISGDANGKCIIFDIFTGLKQKVLRGNRPIFGIMYSPNGKYLVIFRNDNKIEIHDAFTGNLICIMTDISCEDWLTCVPEGFFMGTEYALNNFVYITDCEKNKVYKQLQRTDLISKKLQGKKITQKDHEYYPDFLTIGKAPVVDFCNISTNYRIKKNENTVLNVSLKDSGGGIGKIYFIVNGKRINFADGIASTVGDVKILNIIIESYFKSVIHYGVNSIELYAYDSTDSFVSSINCQLMVTN